MMRFSEVEAFRAVMLSGSTTAAAQMLHTSQPNVSRAIALLERKTGLALFDRLPGRLVPTGDARAFFQEVQKSFAGLNHLEEAAKRIRRFSGGALTVAAVQMLALGLVPKVMRPYCKKFPEVRVSIHTGHSTAIARWVEDQTCDVGLVSQVSNNYGLQFEHLYELDAVCAIPPDHELASKSVITPADIEKEPLISVPRTEHGHSMIESLFGSAGFERQVKLETSYSSIACSLVMEGLGVALINPLVAVNYRHMGMITKPFAPSVKHQGYVIYPKERANERIIVDFISSLKNVLAEQLNALD